MTLITIRETGGPADSPNAAVSFNGRGQYPVTVTDPFSAREEARLEWYFEEYLKFPFTDQVKAREAAASVKSYGETLFEQVFKGGDRAFELYGRYSQARQAGVGSLRFEIVSSPEFHRLHWEALQDPELPRPFAVEAVMVRSTLEPPTVEASSQESPAINLLLVTARPGGRGDVGYRTISRPLVEGLRRARLPVRVDIVRPGRYEALLERLEKTTRERGPGYYHLVHFDLHGALMTYEEFQAGAAANRHTFQQRVGRDDLAPYEGRKAFLFFEGEVEGQADPAEAGEIAGLLLNHHIPIAILNACQSGKQVGVEETSLGSRLLQAGVQTVLAMSYSVTVSAAELLMPALYEQLFGGLPLAEAIRQGRAELFNRKSRRAYFNQQIDLEDWLLPVVYQGGGAAAGPELPLRPFRPEEETHYWAVQAGRYRAPEPSYGFVGRDLDILQIEKRLLARSEGKQRNLLLVRGMGGAGKTTLLHHLAGWWQSTGFVEQVFYFGYDERAWSPALIMDRIAGQLFGATSPQLMSFRVQPPAVQQEQLAARLRAEPHLLILDNLESITGSHLAIRNTLPPEERAALRAFLARLLDGRTLVLLGSRSPEAWLTGSAPQPSTSQPSNLPTCQPANLHSAPPPHRPLRPARPRPGGRLDPGRAYPGTARDRAQKTGRIAPN